MLEINRQKPPIDHQGVPQTILGGLWSRATLRTELGGCTDRTILRLEHAGLPVIVIRGMRFYDPNSVRAWLLTHERHRNEPQRGRPRKTAA